MSTINAQQATVTIPLDIERRLRYDFNAVAELESKVGMPTRALLMQTTLGIYHLRALVWAGCLHEMPDLTVADTTALMDRMYGLTGSDAQKISVDLPGGARTLYFDTFALISLELELGMTFVEIADLDFDGIREIRALLWAGLLHEDPLLTIRNAGDLLTAENLSDVQMAVARAFTASFANVPETTISAITDTVHGLRIALLGPKVNEEDTGEKKVTTRTRKPTKRRNT